MAKVTSENMTIQQVKAARALLDWTALDLSQHCDIGVATIRRFESGVDVSESARQAIFDALSEAGIQLLNGDGPGVRLRQ